MNHSISVGMLLLVASAGASAADPTPTAPAARHTSQGATRPQTAPVARSAARPAPPMVDGRPDAPGPSRPLDLRLGDLRRYFTPAELQSPLPDMIGDEVIVEGGRSTGSEPVQGPIPVGLVAPFWALSHPLSAWRVVLPDPNALPVPRPEP